LPIGGLESLKFDLDSRLSGKFLVVASDVFSEVRPCDSFRILGNHFGIPPFFLEAVKLPPVEVLSDEDVFGYDFQE